MPRTHNPDLTLHQRRRNPTAAELAGIPWLALSAARGDP
jgi:hypothetical protein